MRRALVAAAIAVVLWEEITESGLFSSTTAYSIYGVVPSEAICIQRSSERRLKIMASNFDRVRHFDEGVPGDGYFLTLTAYWKSWGWTKYRWLCLPETVSPVAR